ncbi:hypothetical protein EYF80_044269 [Liparis tanakae]|uniref:Uncharacterized protein n=1 Tax=Liparis tanakae TaxID=230148 RepID=A0A4Z2FXS8_9TELE|nr:hypothetical protein EYF80_044269 [Liparis tanakae]
MYLSPREHEAAQRLICVTVETLEGGRLPPTSPQAEVTFQDSSRPPREVETKQLLRVKHVALVALSIRKALVSILTSSSFIEMDLMPKSFNL